MNKANWTYKKLGDLTKTINGLWTGKKPPFRNIAVIRNTNFTKDCVLNLSNVAYIDVEERQFATRKLQKGDIIIEKSGGSEKQPVGRPVLFNLEEGDYSFSNFTSTLRVLDTSTLLPSYLHKVLHGKYQMGVTLKMQSKTTGLHNLDFKAYNNILIPVPSKDTQLRIVEELDAFNDSITMLQQQVKDLDSLAQSIFYDMFGDPTENPKQWQVRKVGEMASDIKYGTSSPACENGQYKYLRMCNLTYNGYLDMSDIKTINLSETEIEKYIVRRGDILFNRTNSLDLIGKTCMFDEDEPMVIAGYLIRVRLQKEILPVYFARAFNLPSIKTVLRKMAKGAVNQANINSKELASILLPLPPLELQKSFAGKMIEIEASKSLLNAQITEIKSMLSARMQYWFD